LVPSAELATEDQSALGAVVPNQSAPESGEAYIGMSCPAATNVLPSDDEATQFQTPVGVLLAVQVAPESADEYSVPPPAATSTVPSPDEATEFH
jgi:hypothetical protein